MRKTIISAFHLCRACARRGRSAVFTFRAPVRRVPTRLLSPALIALAFWREKRNNCQPGACRALCAYSARPPRDRRPKGALIPATPPIDSRWPSVGRPTAKCGPPIRLVPAAPKGGSERNFRRRRRHCNWLSLVGWMCSRLSLRSGSRRDE